MKNIISMHNINKSYAMGTEQLRVLKNIDLEVKQGEFLTILGPSGSGKSTLMNIIGCMDRPDSGEYLLDGIKVHEATEKNLTRIRNEKLVLFFRNII